MANAKQQLVPPPPPGGMAFPAAPVQDDEANALLDQYLASAPQQQAAPQTTINGRDPEADALLDSYFGVTQQMNPPVPKAAAKKQMVAAPKPAGGPVISRKKEATKLNIAPPPAPPLTLTKPGQQPAPWAQALDQLAGVPLQMARSLPFGIGQHVDPMIQQASQANREMIQQPANAVLSTLAGVPRGLVGIAEDVGNAAFNTGIRALPFSTLQAMGINAIPPAPFQTRQHLDQLTGGANQTLQRVAPASMATGEAAGASMIPMTPHAIKPVSPARAAMQGAIGGQALGTIGSAGAQAKENGPVDFGRAFQEGLPTAAIGAGLGAVAGGVSRIGSLKKSGKAPQAQSPEAPAPEAKAPDMTGDKIVMADGSEFSAAEAQRELKSDHAPPEVKEELKQLLQDRDAEIANAGMRERKTAFSDLGKSPTNEEFSARIDEKLNAATTQAEVRQIQSDALNFLSGRFKGPIRKSFETQINNTAETRFNQLQPKYMKIEGKIPDRDLSAEGYTGRDVKAGNKPVEVQETPEEIQARQQETEERRLFPLAGDQVYGTQKSGIWRPSELSDQQLQEAQSLMRERADLNKNEQTELKALEQETQRRQWLAGKEPAAQEALPPETPQQPQEPAAALEPVAAPPAPKRFFGDSRTYRQGNSGVDAQVKFPSQLEADLVTYAAKGYKNKLGEQRLNKMAEDLGIPREELYQYATEYNNSVKQQAREQAQTVIKAGKVEDVFMDAPPAKRREAPPVVEAAPLENYTRTAPDGYEAPAPKPVGDRFTVQKNTEKKGGYVDIIDSSTGEVISSSKRTEAQAAALAAKYNDLAVNAPDKLQAELRRGTKNFLDFRKKADPERAQIIEKGKTLPEGHELQQPMTRVAEAKHAYDEARARYEAAVDGFYKHIGATQGKTSKRGRKYMQEVEDLVAAARKAGSDELTIEVNSENKLEPTDAPKFQRGMAADEAFSVVENLYKEMQARESELSAAREDVQEPFNSSNLGSVTVPHEKGAVNVRAVPRRGTELNEVAESLRGVVPDKEYVDRKITNVRKAAASKGIGKKPIRTRRNQRGSVRIPIGRKSVPKTAEEAMIAGEKTGDKTISDLQNTADKVRGILTLRNTFDIAREVSPDLHNELMLGVGKEAMLAHGIKFEPEQAALVDLTLNMEPWTIREGGKVEVQTSEGGTTEVDLTKFTPEQLNFLATRRSVRSRMGEAVKEAMDTMLEEFGSPSNMPARVKQRYEVLQQLHDVLTGNAAREGTSEGAAFGIIRNALYDYIFKWNVAYHLLNLTDPFMAGALRVGMTRIMAAKAMLATNPEVRAYVKGVPGKSPIQELRAEVNARANRPLPKGVRADWSTKAAQKLSNLQSKLPDLPSERWNFEDSFAAGVILHGDQIGYKGGGTQYLHDLATGKLNLDQQIKLYAEAMNTAQEITGSGSFNLNKDTVQRIGPLAKAAALFTSYPLRVQRLLREAIREAKTNPWEGGSKLAAFAAATVFFGGRALLPKELDLLELPKETRGFYRGLQDLLDKGNIFKAITGRDLTDKVRNSFLPFIGGLQTNLVVDEFNKMSGFFAGGKASDKAKEAACYWALSAVLGGGGLEASKIGRAAATAEKGDKDVYASFDFPLKAGSSHPAGKKSFKRITGKSYDNNQAVVDALAPGVDAKIGSFIKSARRAKIDKTFKK